MPTIPKHLTLILPLLLLCANLPSARAAARPVAQILTPASGFKLRQGQTASVTIKVDGGVGLSWTLSLQAPDSAAVVVTSGTGPVFGATVAVISAATLAAGETYELMLSVTFGRQRRCGSHLFHS